jgi:hypothetical protein
LTGRGGGRGGERATLDDALACRLDAVLERLGGEAVTLRLDLTQGKHAESTPRAELARARAATREPREVQTAANRR